MRRGCSEHEEQYALVKGAFDKTRAAIEAYCKAKGTVPAPAPLSEFSKAWQFKPESAINIALNALAITEKNIPKPPEATARELFGSEIQWDRTLHSLFLVQGMLVATGVMSPEQLSKANEDVPGVTINLVFCPLPAKAA